MKKILTTLRNKPEGVREQIALFAATGVTLLIVGIWAASLGTRFSSKPVAIDETSGERIEPEKPFSLFFKSLSSDLKQQRKDLKENNPFSTYDETASFEESTPTEDPTLTPDGMIPETGEVMIIDASLESSTPPAGDINETTETDPSKDPIVDENVVQ